MKKIFLTIAIVLGFALSTFAHGGGVFGYGDSRDGNFSDASRGEGDGTFISLPTTHGAEGDISAQEEGPLGSGALLLLGFGAAYAMAKRNKK